MQKITCILLLFFMLQIKLEGQIRPAEGKTLNYRIIGFSTPEEARTMDYAFEIAAGNFYNADSFSKNIIKTIHSRSNRIIEEVPQFGSEYTWRIIYRFKQSNKTITALFHFKTGTVPEVDTNQVRLKITKQSLNYKDAYIFLDDNKVLYDINGKPVWYLPKLEGHPVTPRNMKLSRQGTITFVSDPPYEINYEGEVLWKPPPVATVSGDNSEHFHHQFTRLANGNYMVLGQDSVYYIFNSTLAGYNKPNDLKHLPGHSISGNKLQFGTLIEYDSRGKVIWSWKSSDYFTKVHPGYLVRPSDGTDMDVHENSFHFDEKHKNIYISFKNINRILKVKYPEGNVINDYGGINLQESPDKNFNIFCGQHSLKQTHEGYLMLFNNNYCNSGSLPAVEILEEAATDTGNLKLLWKYSCPSPFQSSYGFPSGGNVIELTDYTIFVSTAAPDSRVFIVNRDKEVLWEALPQRWNQRENKWDPIGEYRASIIQNKAALERLIWHGQIVDTDIVTANNDNSVVGKKIDGTGTQ